MSRTWLKKAWAYLRIVCIANGVIESISVVKHSTLGRLLGVLCVICSIFIQNRICMTVCGVQGSVIPIIA